MINSNFVHLHVHSHYSILDGYGTPKQYAERAAKLGFEAVGLTDHGSVDGALEWQRAMRAAGLRGILGAELYIVNDVEVKEKGDQRAHITLWVYNAAGWKTLLNMITRSHIEGHYYRPRIDPGMLCTVDLDGLVIGTACIQSFFHKLSAGAEFLADLHRRAPGRVYLEVMPHDMPEQKSLNQLLFDIAQDCQLPLLATNDCHYVTRRQESVQEVMLAIQKNQKWNDPARWRFSYRGLYLRTADEMAAAFEAQNVLPRGAWLRAMRNTLAVAELCGGFEIPKQMIQLPPVEAGEDVYEVIEKSCSIRLAELFGGCNIEYTKRFWDEFDLIKAKNFGLYFRMVADLIHWCQREGIAIGPGRGSVGGSLIAYLMGITAVDPIRWGLSFERFISADRIDWPDIDIDIEKYRRGEAQDYLRRKYGQYAVAGIATFGEIGGRAAVHDVGRVFDWPAEDVKELAIAVPYNNTTDSGKIAALDPVVADKFRKKYPDQWRYIGELEGQIRSLGQHAAAVVVADHDLRFSNRCSLRANRDTGAPIVNWSMEDAEYNGLIKIDLLGLSTLSVFSEAERLIRCGKNPDFRLWDVPVGDDPRVFEMLSMGMTGGVFQLSAGASMRLCQDMKPRNFEEIVAIMALVRPGPADSGMTADYLQRRRTGRWPRLNSIYEEVTAKTFGVLVYQEQVMKVISRVAGLPENTADKIRKIIGKKRDPEEFRPYWEMFRDGCLKMGTLTETEAEHFWEGLQKWAGYGFNRAHSVEYATLAYWSGFLKIHYPVEFFCALLSYGEFDDKREDKSRQRIMDEMAEAGLEIIPPKVGKSDACRWTTDGQSVFTPFVEIKGVGEEMARKCAGAAPEKTCPGGFFNISSFGGSATRGTKLEKVLKDIGAYDLEKRDWPPEYFSFCFDGRVSERAEAGRNHRPRALADSNQPARSRRSGHEGDGPPDGCAQKADHLPVNPITRGRFRLELPRECWGCELGANGHFPVPPSMGIYRAMIVGEAPGFEEDRDRRGFVGRAGDVLWDELARYNLTRRMFHVTNACKCFPAALKTPKPEHIKECYQFLSQEMAGVAPGLILVLGNVAYSAVWGGDREPKGITRLSGTTELDSRTWKTDLVYCVHPSAVLRNPGQNRPAFEAGIKLFAEMFLKMKED